jgi:hypothetical protein
MTCTRCDGAAIKDALTNGAVDLDDCGRCTSDDIEGYLSTLD